MNEKEYLKKLKICRNLAIGFLIVYLIVFWGAFIFGVLGG